MSGHLIGWDDVGDNNITSERSSMSDATTDLWSRSERIAEEMFDQLQRHRTTKQEEGFQAAERAMFNEARVAYSPGFVVKDSGERHQFESGMVRDTTAGKMRPDLVKDGPMYLRWVRLLTHGAIKYIARNWMKAEGQEEYERFLESTDRHYTIWYTWRTYGLNIEDPDNPTTEPLKEDHAAAVFFNINGVEYLAEAKEKAAASA